MILDLIYVAGGLIALTLGADYLVQSVVTVAQKFNVSTLFIGLTVVALGTSLPEFFVVVESVIEDAPGIGMGNIVGSNIANLLLILGIAAVCRPIDTPKGMLGRDGLAMLLGTAVFVTAASTGLIGFWTGLLFVGLLAGYLIYCSMDDGEDDEDIDALEASGLKLTLVLLVSAAALIGGSELLVLGSISLAREWGVSESVIGLTLVAVGTSLPELAATLAAVRRKQSAIILGNVLGSNLFNILGVIGGVALFTPVLVPPAIREMDLWLMALATLVTLVLLRTGWRLDRREGSAMLLCYGVYVVFQFGFAG
ncbi:calcium/sodium antiporter [Litoreibacter roseus]|uniref:Sodium:calcium antiporter n=1 Tax=Litoreibacter roseus TaxID=2601869 RepID=A0A6N6JDG8_9RHOB|nr:calcium/sodium antiporter [Litoreibacter roseus]GFE64195.1 sodium:calcium antiporter [Litoreibacter roseus]